MSDSQRPLSETPARHATSERDNLAPLLIAFLISGCPALVYQLVWQRALFSIYGVNVEAITVVVAAFMLGLGLGSLLGGWLSRAEGHKPLLLFAGLECGIGLFGLGSLPLLRWVGAQTLGASLWQTGAYTFCLVLVPTCLMGATLPLLVAHLVRQRGSVGRSLGVLYFVNTLGSALACFLCALFLLPRLGMQGSVTFAALLNLAVAAFALLVVLKGRRQAPHAPQNHARTVERSAEGEFASRQSRAPALPFSVGVMLSAATGFIALSHEILWSRIYGFASGGSAHSFPFLLGCYLLGIAIGSQLSGRVCRGLDLEPSRAISWLVGLLLLANGSAFLLPPLVSWIAALTSYFWAFVPLVLVSAALGAAFPLIGQLCVSPDRLAGSRVSYLYMANILGSTLGSLLTGFVLMDVLPFARIATLITLLGALVAAALFLRGPSQGAARRQRLRGLAVAVCASGAGIYLGGLSYRGLYERLLPDHPSHDPATPFAEVLENRHGVIAVTERGTVFGGGIYDGVYSTDLIVDRNGLIRPFALGAFHPAPKQVLSIGLSSGSWAQVLVNHPEIERLTVIEINPGYVELLQRHPAVASLRNHPKLELVIDDGRRWLGANPARRFDAVVMNTTFHWRSHSTNLLSEEFFQQLRAHLLPGGIAMLNTTSSDEVYRTGAVTFPYAFRFFNTVVVSDTEMHPSRERWTEQLSAYRIDARPVFDLPRQQSRLDDVLTALNVLGAPDQSPFESREQILARTQTSRVITDDNMVVEWLNIH